MLNADDACILDDSEDYPPPRTRPRFITPPACALSPRVFPCSDTTAGALKITSFYANLRSRSAGEARDDADRLCCRPTPRPTTDHQTLVYSEKSSISVVIVVAECLQIQKPTSPHPQRCRLQGLYSLGFTGGRETRVYNHRRCGRTWSFILDSPGHHFSPF